MRNAFLKLSLGVLLFVGCEPPPGSDDAGSSGGSSGSAGGGTVASGGGTSAVGGGTASTGGGTSTVGGGTASTGGGTSAVGGGTASTGGGTSAVGGGTASTGGGTSAVGGGTVASGGGSSAGGGGTASTGGGTSAVGGGTASTGGGTSAVGGGTASTGGGTSAGGGGTAASGGGTSAVGGGTAALGGGTSAVGGGTTSTGGGTSAVGGGTAASGGGTSAVGGGTASTGGGTSAVGGGTVATGGGTAASGGGTSAVGGGTAASGGGTSAVGGGTVATGGGSSAGGGGTAASGGGSSAVGGGTTASGGGSSAVGGGTAASGGGTPDAGIPQTFRVFTSSIYLLGNLQKTANTTDGLSGGDKICQLLADSTYLSGTWTAFLSSPSVRASTRIASNGSWTVMGNHGLAFANAAAIGTTSPVNPINYDERGRRTQISQSPYIGGEAWTGTERDGGISPNTCNGWTTTATNVRGAIAYTDTWLSPDTTGCFSGSGLYCFETSKTRPDGGTSYPPQQPAKRMFVTSNVYWGDFKTLGAGTTGLQGADNLCASAATAASLGGTWVAWLSTSTTRAIDRITSPGPWKLVGGDGGIVFSNHAALTILAPDRPINLSEWGTTPTETNGYFWAGTEAGGGSSGATCSNWQSAAANVTGSIGSTLSSGQGQGWLGGSGIACSGMRAILCIEQ